MVPTGSHQTAGSYTHDATNYRDHQAINLTSALVKYQQQRNDGINEDRIQYDITQDESVSKILKQCPLTQNYAYVARLGGTLDDKCPLDGFEYQYHFERPLCTLTPSLITSSQCFMDCEKRCKLCYRKPEEHNSIYTGE